MNWLLEPFFGGKVRRETGRYLQQLERLPVESSRRATQRFLEGLRRQKDPKVTLGVTEWKEEVTIPLVDLIGSHGLVTGGTGSGKSFFALLILKALIEGESRGQAMGFGVIDAKGDLFQGALYLLGQRLQELARQNPKAARELRRRVVIYDFSSSDPVSSYNILARWPNTEPDFFAFNRADLLLDLLAGSDKLSLGSISLLRKLILLLSEFDLPITYLTDILDDDSLRTRLLSRSRQTAVRQYFVRQFPSVPKSTIAALYRRMEALFSSEGVRLALSGKTAPDFCRFQEQGRIVLINCFSENIARSVRHLLQGLILSDIRQAVFARRHKENPFLWFCDEAQNFFLTEKLRDNMADLLTMSRSFGSFFLYLTQNMGTAVQDARVLRILHTNIRWAFAMRGEPTDCAFLKPALPITGRKLRQQTDPFEPKRFHSISEERSMMLDAITHLPDRVGWLWFKYLSSEVVKITTQHLAMPQAEDLSAAIHSIRRDRTIGRRLSRKQYEGGMAERDGQWREPETDSLSGRLEQAYERTRGKSL